VTQSASRLEASLDRRSLLRRLRLQILNLRRPLLPFGRFSLLQTLKHVQLELRKIPFSLKLALQVQHLQLLLLQRLLMKARNPSSGLECVVHELKIVGFLELAKHLVLLQLELAAANTS